MFLYLLAAVVVLLALIQLKARLTRRKDLPPEWSQFPTLPWLGSVIQFATGPREFLQRGNAKLGDIFTVKLFGKNITFLMGTGGHQHFFHHEEAFDIREAYKCTIVTFGQGVCYDCPAAIMGQQFAFLKNGLVDQKFHTYTRIIQEEFEAYFDEKWGDAGEKCLFTALSEIFTLTSSHCLLGDEIRAAWKGEYAKSYHDLDHSFVPILFFFPDIPNPHRSKCVKARKMFEDLFESVVKKRRDNNEEHDDFLQVLMDSKYRDGRPLTMQEITGIMIGTLLGGQHTSNVTGTWTLCHLLTDPTWLSAVMDEQKKILGGDLTSNLSYDDVKDLKVLDAVLDEGLRLHPPFFQLMRVAVEDTQFTSQSGDTYTIPKGNFVGVSPGAVQRSPDMWERPEVFDPSRFYPENADKIKKYAWIPFGGGKHQCSGRKFAAVSLKLGMSWLLRNYKLELVTPFPKDDYTTMVVAPSAPVTVRYQKIKR